MASRADGGYDPALDGLRAVAIALVMVHHFGYVNDFSVAGKLLGAFAGPGWVGVDLFFVLSGYLITGICLDHRGSGFFRAFYVRRAIRILPPYALVLAAVLGTLTAFGKDTSGTVALVTFTSNIVLAASGDWHAVPQAARHFWSLAVEEQFYLVWPLTASLMADRRIARVAMLCVPAALLVRTTLITNGASSLAGYILMPARMDTLAVGALLAVIARDPDWRRSAVAIVRRIDSVSAAVWGTLLLALPLAITSSVGGGEPYSPVMQTIGLTVVALLGGCVVAAVVFGSNGAALRRVLSRPGMVTIGRYSYAMYLIHVPVNAGLRAAGVVPVTAIGAIGFVLGASALTFVLASLSWRYVEAPVLRLKRLAPYGRPATALVAESAE